jgi:hypothetical protein
MSTLTPAMAVPSTFNGSDDETGSGTALVQPPEKSAQVIVMLFWPAVKVVIPPVLETAS